MTKQEFISDLREALEGNIPLQNVEENIRFYEEYFRSSPDSEQKVCEELGDPRLIARTIIDSFTASKGSMAGYYTEQARSEFSREERAQSMNQERESYGQEEEKWYDKLFRILILGVILLVVGAVLIFLLKVAVYVVIPVLVILLLVKILSDLFQRY